MNTQRWQQVNDLFHSAVERAPEERTAFLDAACQGDESLRREMKSLLASHERTENFIESPAFETAPDANALTLRVRLGYGEVELPR